MSDSNWGSELDESLSYHHGNKQPLGFGETSADFSFSVKAASLQNVKNLN